MISNKKILYFTFLLLLFLYNFQLFSQLVVLDEDFNSSSTFPNGWSQVQVNGTDTFIINNGGYNHNGTKHPSSAHSGTRNAFLFSSSGSTCRLITPPLNLSGLGNVKLKFYEAREKWGNDQDKLRIYYKVGSGNWTLIAYFGTNTPNWTLRTVTLPNPNSNYYIAFEGEASYGYGVCIDDIIITGELAYDAGIVDFDIVNHDYLYALLRNSGTQALTTVTIKWKIDTLPTKSFLRTGGGIAKDSQLYVLIDTVNLSHGLHTLKIWTENPNNKSDGNPVNDTLETTYYLISNFPYQESFESSNAYWSQDENDDFDWTRKKNSTPTYGTGPSSAHDGLYYYYASALNHVNQNAIFHSPDLNLEILNNPYLEFWYHMYSDPQINQPVGSLILMAEMGFTIQDSLWYISGNQGNQWHKAEVSLDSFSNLSQISFKAIPASYWSDIAIDDIRIYDKPYIDLGQDVTICFGDSITFSAPDGLNYSYVWISNGDTLSTSRSITVDTSMTLIGIVMGDFNTVASDTVQISLHPYPRAGFTLSSPPFCKGYPVKFFNTSYISSGALQASWYVEDTLITAGDTFSFSFNQPGNHQVKLVVTSQAGCSDTFNKLVYINPTPSTSIFVSDTGACMYEQPLSFQASGDSFVAEYIWNFGDGTVDTFTQGNHFYQQAGYYHGMTVAITDSACLDTSVFDIRIYPVPYAAFQTQDTALCFDNHHFQYTNNSGISSGTIQFLWDFGDGHFDTSRHTWHTYAQPGTYITRLVVYSNNNCKDTAEMSLEIYPEPLAGFSLQSQSYCLKNNQIILSDTSTLEFTSGKPDSTLWFIDNQFISRLRNLTFTFADTGLHSIMLISGTNKGCLDTAHNQVMIYSDPDVKIKLDSFNHCLKENYFRLSARNLSSSSSVKYLWKYGSKTDTTSSVLYHFQNEGKHEIHLIAISNQNCSDTDSVILDVFPVPSLKFHIDTISACERFNQFNITNLSSISSGSLSYKWYSDGLLSDTISNPSFSFSTPGNHMITLVGISEKLCSDTISESVIVYPDPEAQFSVNDSIQCWENNLFEFTNLSSFDSNYYYPVWSTGDGTQLFSRHITYHYNEDGVYIVKLLITNGKFCSDSMTKTITVSPQPRPDIGQDTTIHMQDTILLTTKKPYESYLWSTGDTLRWIVISGKDLNPGNNSISIIVYDSNGCQGMDSVVIFLDTTNGFHEKIVNNFEIFPNPASDFITIKSSHNPIYGQLYITDMGGKLLWSSGHISLNSRYILSVSFLSRGIYNLTVVTKETVWNVPFIKQ